MQRLKEYTPVFAGVLLIALGLWLPLGYTGAPSLIELLSALASNVLSTPL